MPLTDKQIKATLPAEKDYKLADEKGVFLLIKKNGSKYWRMKYRFQGKEKLLALGVYPEVSLKQARLKRDEARQLLAQGIDPVAKKHADLAADISASQSSFERVALEWIEIKQSDKMESYRYKVLRYLERNLFPHIGDIPCA